MTIDEVLTSIKKKKNFSESYLLSIYDPTIMRYMNNLLDYWNLLIDIEHNMSGKTEELLRHYEAKVISVDKDRSDRLTMANTGTVEV